MAAAVRPTEKCRLCQIACALRSLVLHKLLHEGPLCCALTLSPLPAVLQLAVNTARTENKTDVSIRTDSKERVHLEVDTHTKEAAPAGG